MLVVIATVVALLFPVNAMSPPAETPRFVTVKAPEPDSETAPPVRRARVDTPVGARAAETVIAPELVPPISPTLKVPAVTEFTSAETRDKLPAVSVPRFIGVVAVVGAMVTTPDVVEIVLVAEIARVLARTITVDEAAAVTLPVSETAPPLSSIGPADVSPEVLTVTPDVFPFLPIRIDLELLETVMFVVSIVDDVRNDVTP